MIRYGFTGKLPTSGDFVSRGWPGDACNGLDALLQSTLAELLRSSVNARQAIVHAPCMVLSIRPGVIGAQGMVCAVLASHDRVGRTFPLCAGVACDAALDGMLEWPSLAYAHSLIARVNHALDMQADPDELLEHIRSVGDPREFSATFHGCGADDTLPRLGRAIRLLRIQGPQAALTPHLRALCSLLPASSDVLGIRLDGRGKASDLFACRRFDARAAGPAWAALFDGNWVARGWTSYEASARVGVADVSNPVPHEGD